MSKCEHIELSTDDPTGASDFYSKLFGWKIKGQPNPDGQGEYLMFQTDNGGGGIAGKMMPEQPTAWMPYITVPSVTKSIETATGLGAQVTLGHTPIGDMGAIAVLRDPTGAAFGLYESSKPPPKAKAAPKAKKAAKPAAKKPAKKPAKKKKK
jgi:predicted enzyme related to lactoylglutathione lyase